MFKKFQKMSVFFFDSFSKEIRIFDNFVTTAELTRTFVEVYSPMCASRSGSSSLKRALSAWHSVKRSSQACSAVQRRAAVCRVAHTGPEREIGDGLFGGR
eukprot:EG_transcript_42377